MQVRLAERLGAPQLASFYGDDATHARFTESPRWRRVYRRLFDRVAAVLAEGPAMAARVEGLGCPPGKLRVVRLPANADVLDRIAPDRAEDFVVVLAGRFTAKKGFGFGIRAFARALRRRAGARLLLVGGGEEEGELRRIVAEEGLGDQVTWAGRQRFEPFMRLVASARLALFPSRTGRHGDSDGGAPVTLAEAQWLGVPAIVSAHDDLPYLAAPGASLVLPTDDLDAWAEALAELYGNPSRLGEMGPAAARFARAEHSPAANMRAREEIYESAL
jgi:glycosyltransferase involved in cell wall biosynthesis